MKTLKQITLSSLVFISLFFHGKTAIKVLRGSPEILQEQVDAGNVTVNGDEEKIEQLRPILEIIRTYLKDLRE